MTTRCYPRNRLSRGVTLVESIVALAVAATLLSGIAQLLTLVSRQHRISEQRALAALEAGNLMEEWMSRPWSELTAESAATAEPSDWLRQSLPSPQLTVKAIDEGAAGEIRRIEIQINWLSPAGRPTDPLRLVAWRHRYPEAAK
jgi:prepilin-type N-terminal cleavage/methylation domain-containing protein